jgi:hypothetical protein
MSASQRSLEMGLNPTPLPLTQLHCTQTLVHVREYVHLMCALAPNTFATPLNETIAILCHLHSLADVDLLSFVNDFHQEMDLVLNK